MIIRERSAAGILNYKWLLTVLEEKGISHTSWLALKCRGHKQFDTTSGIIEGKLGKFEETLQRRIQLHNTFLDYLNDSYRRGGIVSLACKTADYHNERDENCLHMAVKMTTIDSQRMRNEQQSQFAEVGEQLINALIHLCVELSHQDESGETPVMALVRSPLFSMGVLRLLLRQGANPNLRDCLGGSASHLAVTLGNVHATETFIKFQADLHARNRKGLGIVAAGRAARRAAEKDGKLLLTEDIETCIARMLEAGAVEELSVHQEWDLANHDLQTRPAWDSYYQCPSPLDVPRKLPASVRYELLKRRYRYRGWLPYGR